jgi:hypothetical protein
MPQKMNQSYNYTEPNQDYDYNNRSTNNIRNPDKDRMPSEIKQLEKLKNKIKDLECKISTISKPVEKHEYKYIK